MKRIRVCLVGPSLDILGGQSVQLERLRARLSHVPEIEVSVLAVNPRLQAPFSVLQRIKYLRTVVNTVVYVCTLFARLWRVDVVHAYSASYWSYLLSPVPAMLVGRLYGKKVILNYHSGEAEDHLARWRSAVPLAKLAHAIIVPSGYLVQVFGMFGLRAREILNFIEIERFPFRARGVVAPRFLANRNLEPLYNVSCVLRAFAEIQRAEPHAQLVVAGDGSERASLESLASTLGLRHVTFLGRVPPERMPALYNEADVYLNAPNIDNMPLSVIEAFAAGIPVVTTDAGGIPFIVRHNENALMVPRDDALALAREALRLLRDPALATRLSHAAHEECERRYTWNAVNPEWLALYTGLVRGASASRPRIAV